MMKSLAVGVVIGGAVAGSFNRMLGDVKSGMDSLRGKADNTRLWQKTITETQALQRQMGMLQGTSGRAFDDTKRKFAEHTAKLQSAKINVGNLTGEYERLGRVVKGLDLQMRGQAQWASGMAQLGEGTRTLLAAGGTAGLLTSKAANYQAELRDIGIKAGFNYQTDGAEREAKMGRQIAQAAAENGMDESALAKAVNDLVAGGMGISEALNYAKLAAKTTVGQKTEATDVTKMMGTLSSTLGITTEKGMTKALGILAVQGKAGKFEFNAMARYLPNLATDFANLGMQGEEAVRGLGAAFQVMRMGAGTDEEAAGNLKNWLGKVGSGETVKNYDDVNIDYKGELLKQAKAGKNPFEASLELARQYIEKTDAATAKRLQAAADEAALITDQAKRDEYVKKLEGTFKTGDLFADMQVKSALAAYLQNRDKYAEIRDAKGSDTVLDDDLAARRAASAQKWAEAQNAFSTSLRLLGDSLAPLTDVLAGSLTWLATGVGNLAQAFPPLTTVVLGALGAFAAWKTVSGGWKLGKGALDLLRGKALAGKGVLPNLLGQAAEALDGGVQKVFVVNMPGSGFGDGADLPDGPDGDNKSKKTRKAGKPRGKAAGRLGGLGGLGQTLKNAGSGVLDLGKGLGARLGGWGTAALTAGRTALSVGGTGVGAGSAATGSVGALAGGTLAASGALVAGAGAAGYGAGTLAYDHAIAGTNLGDSIGRGISKTLAFFGNQEAQEALAREARYAASLTPASPHKPAALVSQLRQTAAPVAVATPSSGPAGGPFTYSPVYHLAPGTPEAVKAAVAEGSQRSFQEFKQMYARLMAEQARRAF